MTPFAETPVDVPASCDASSDPLKRQEAVVAMGRRAVATPDPSLLLEDAAALIADMLQLEHWLLAEANEGTGQLALQLALGQPAGGRKTIGHQTSAQGGQSLAGYALEAGHAVITDDLDQEPRFRDAFLRRHHIRSGIAIPLRVPQKSFGVLAACSSNPRVFHADDLLFAETVSHLVTTTVARSQAERALAEQQKLTTGLLQTIEAIVIVLDPRGHIVRVNRTCEHLTGFSSDEICGRPIGEVLPAAEELDLFQSIFQRLRQGEGSVRYESYLLTKHSQRRRIAWSYDSVHSAAGRLDSILATGIDITPQREAEERASRAEQAAEQARQAISRLAASGDRTCEPPARTSDPNAAATAVIPPILNEDRRNRTRRSYPYQQSIAPVLNGELPDPASFYQVQCNDIAAGGFSYLASKPPESDSLIVALGSPPSLTYLHAQVAHVTRVRRGENWMYLVGCAYSGRVAY